MAGTACMSLPLRADGGKALPKSAPLLSRAEVCCQPSPRTAEQSSRGLLALGLPASGTVASPVTGSLNRGCRPQSPPAWAHQAEDEQRTNALAHQHAPGEGAPGDKHPHTQPCQAPLHAGHCLMGSQPRFSSQSGPVRQACSRQPAGSTPTVVQGMGLLRRHHQNQDTVKQTFGGSRKVLRERLLCSRHAGHMCRRCSCITHVQQRLRLDRTPSHVRLCSTVSKAPPAVSTMRRQATLAATSRRCSSARRAAQACQMWNLRARERCCRPTLKRRAWRVPRMVREAVSQKAASATARRALDPLQNVWSCCSCSAVLLHSLMGDRLNPQLSRQASSPASAAYCGDCIWGESDAHTSFLSCILSRPASSAYQPWETGTSGRKDVLHKVCCRHL